MARCCSPGLAVALEEVVGDGNGLLIRLVLTAVDASGLSCGLLSRRVHSWCRGRLRDVAVADRNVLLDYVLAGWCVLMMAVASGRSGNRSRN